MLWGLEINCNFGDSIASSVGNRGISLWITENPSDVITSNFFLSEEVGEQSCDVDIPIYGDALCEEIVSDIEEEVGLQL